jgi:hypothetical protein
MNKFGGRKFILCMLIAIISTSLVIYGAITAINFRDLILGTAGLYIGGNVSQKVFSKEQIQ